MQLSTNQINNLSKEQGLKQAEIDKFDAEVEEHKKGLDVLLSEIDRETVAYQDWFDKNGVQQKKNRDLIDEYMNLSSRLAQAKQSMIDDQVALDVARNDIADRVRALDERENTLVRREHKVTEGERIVQQNASYLNL